MISLQESGPCGRRVVLEVQRGVGTQSHHHRPLDLSAGPDVLGPDGSGRDRLGPDGLGPDGLGPDGLGPDGNVRATSIRHSTIRQLRSASFFFWQNDEDDRES